LLVERFVEHGRHIEVQVAADETGRVVHLFERDCSAQRRHQKVVEEAPAPGLGGALRDGLCAGAVRLASSVGYLSLGTVEFLVAGDEAWFLEMNTRLQVEHRVTEAVTGVDLVRLQLEIAQGRPIPFTQAELACRGHAIEARVYAEDPEAGFLPQAGTPSLVRFPGDVLVDTGVSEGRAVTTFYDPMLAKIVVAAPTRRAARERLLAALDDSAIFGVRTNLGYLRRLVASPGFERATVEVNTLDRVPLPAERAEALVALAVAADVLSGKAGDSPLGANDGWRLGGPPALLAVELFWEGAGHVLVVDRTAGTVGGGGGAVRLELIEETRSRRRYVLDGVEAVFHFAVDEDAVTVGYHGASYRFDRRRRPSGPGAATPGGDVLRAPMPGVVRRVETAPGSSVRAGEVLVLLESMKMELQLRAPRDGVVAEVAVAPGDHVGLDAPVVRLDPPSPSAPAAPPGRDA
jgi:3-methylcrotonyl-CoA carboxylase alpha subunit/acetyl-CoA/propionyl-CoA carboxylase biotin carboxyl carrier protein